MFCSNCGHEISPPAKHCSNCGKDLSSSVKYCSHCGKELLPNAKHCNNCGKEVNLKEVGLIGQTILAAIPSVVTQLIAFYRIRKLKKGVLIYLGVVGASLGLNMILPFPYGLIVGLSFEIPIPVYFVRKWTREFNALM